MRATLDPVASISVLFFVSVVYLVLVLLIVGRYRSVERGLLALGLLTGVVTIWCGLFTAGQGISVQARPEMPGQAALAFELGGAVGILGRMAILLTLAAIAIALLGQWSYPLNPAQREEANRANPG